MRQRGLEYWEYQILYCQQEILRWDSFKKQTTYFQSIATDAIERLKREIITANEEIDKIKKYNKAKDELETRYDKAG